MPNYVPSISVDQVIVALKDFIQPFLPADGTIVRGQTNRVPLPANPCVVLTELLEYDLNLPYDVFERTSQITDIHASTRIDVQIDFYGLAAGNYCKAVKSALRTLWGYGQFPITVKPLYCDDGRQVPLITGEEQYESRWTLTASLQYNPIVTVPQQSATALDSTIEVPADFPV